MVTIRNYSNKVLVILGTTASGKTQLAIYLAKKFNGEIISADSRQVYKGMDIGTGKDISEYGKIAYHGIDIISPKKQFTVADFQQMAYRAIEDISSRGKLPIICGGTGLYIDAVTQGYQLKGIMNNELGIRKKLNRKTLYQLLVQLQKVDLKTYKTIDKKNRRRVQRALEIYYQTGEPQSKLQKKKKPPYEFLFIGVTFPKEILKKRIQVRLKNRLKQGMIQEVKKLHVQGVSWKRMEEYGLEYRWISRYARGKISRENMEESLYKDIIYFAKRQMTWFKRNQNIQWIRKKSEAGLFAKVFLTRI